MLRLGNTLEDRVVLIERLVIEACLTRVNTHIDRLLQPSVLHLIDFPLTDHAVVGASFLVTYCQDGTIMRCDSDSGKKLIKSMVLRTADRQGMC